MRMNRLIANVGLATAVIAGALVSSGANASSITVLNPSFETLPAGGLNNGTCGSAGGCWSYAQIPDWSTSQTDSPGGLDYGQFQPLSSTPSPFTYLTAGPTIAFLDYGATISQSVGTAVAGITYTLQVDEIGRAHV